MAITNIVEEVQKNLGYAPLVKVDPNVHEPKANGEIIYGNDLAQAAIPAVLAAFFKLSQSEEGSATILSADPEQNWLEVLFEGKEAEVVDKLAHYAAVSNEETIEVIEKIAAESIRLIQEVTANTGTTQAIKSFMGDQRHHILVYLPASLQLGYLLNDNTLDDRTNKMEGPISNLVHKIENKFSGSDS